MNTPTWSTITHVCAASVVAVMSLFAVGSMYLFLVGAFEPLRTVQLAAVERSAKADRLAFADVTLTVARSGKADGHFSSVALTAVATSEMQIANGSIRFPDPVFASGEAPVVVSIAPEAVPAAEDRTPELSEGDAVVIEPVAHDGETATNVTQDPVEQGTRSDAAWDYSQDVFERAGQRAKVLWDILFGND